MRGSDIRHLAFLAGHDTGAFGHLLADPCTPLWYGRGEGDFTTAWRRTEERLSADKRLIALLRRRLIGDCLVWGEKRPGWLDAWITANISVADQLPGVSWESARRGKWRRVPVAAAAKEVRLCWFVAGWAEDRGVGPAFPDWAAEVLNPAARQAVTRAAAAALQLAGARKGRNLFCFPLLEPGLRIEGTSLGLALALAFCTVLRGDPESSCLATGDIDEGGTVGAVGSLEQKLALAAEKGFKLFLCPVQNGVPQGCDGTEVLPVRSLCEARMFAILHTPGNAARLIRLSDSLDSAASFIREVGNLPAVYLSWAMREGRLDSLMADIGSSPRRFQQLAGVLRHMISAGNAESVSLLTGGIPGRQLERMSAEMPQAVSHWCTAGMWAANRLGRVADADAWGRRAEKIGEAIRESDPDAAAGYACMRLLSRHNRFIFSPRLPESVRVTLKRLESIFEAERSGGKKYNLALGRLCGTIAQNYGFCGPQWLRHTRKYAAQARLALGEGVIPDLRNEWLRQYNYLVYASLDAARPGEALKNLLTYLAVDTLEDLRLSELTEWQHAALVRYLADTPPGDSHCRYLKLALEKDPPRFARRHPWQLWLHNLGRLCLAAGRRNDARDLFRRSLDICTHPQAGATMRAMALVPLSGLHQLGSLRDAGVADRWAKARLTALELNPKHFVGLRGGNTEEVLEQLWRNPALLFPFAYR